MIDSPIARVARMLDRDGLADMAHVLRNYDALGYTAAEVVEILRERGEHNVAEQLLIADRPAHLR